METSYTNFGVRESPDRSYTPIFRTFLRNSNVCVARSLNCSNSDLTWFGVYASGLISLALAASSVRSGNRNIVASYEDVRSHPNVSRYPPN